MLLALLRASGLQVVHHALQLRQELLRLVAIAGAGKVFQLVEHVVEILLAQHVLGILLRFALLVGHAFGQRLEKFLHRGAQLRHQPLDLLVGGAIFQRFGQGLLGVPQPPFGKRQIAVLDAERDFPEVVCRVLQSLLAACHGHAGTGAFQRDEVAEIGNGLVGAQHDRLVEGDRPRHLAGIERKDLPLLCDRGRERFVEVARGQLHLDRLAAAGLAGAVGCNKRDPHHLAGERVFGDVAARHPLGVAGIVARQVELVFGQGIERRRARLCLDRHDLGMGLAQAVIVPGDEGDFERAVDCAARHAVESDLRGIVRRNANRPEAVGDAQFAGFRQFQLVRARGHRGVWRGCRRGCRDGRLTAGVHLGAGGERAGRIVLFRHIEDCAVRLLNEEDLLVGNSAADADSDFGFLRHGDAGRVLRPEARKKDRRLAGITRRRDPGVDADRWRLALRHMLSEGIGDGAGPVGAGIGECRDEEQGRHGAQRIAVVAGDIRLRQAGVQGCDAFGHAPLVFLPQRAGKGRVGSDLVVLYRDRLVGKAVALFEQPVGL